MLTVTSEEIEQFRSQLLPYPAAISTLEVIQSCDGYLDDAIVLLMMREMEQEPDRSLNDLMRRCQKVICQEEFRNDLAGGMIAVVIEPLASGVGIPPGVATAVAIYAFKRGIKSFCEADDITV